MRTSSSGVTRLSILQHVAFEGPAALLGLARERGFDVQVTRLDRGDPLPMLEDRDVLVLLGGPMSVHEGLRHPWLTEEIRYVEHALDAKRKVLGICLGAQIIARACGAAVTRMPEREIGWFPVRKHERASATRWGRGFPQESLAFHWHGETFSLPAGAIPLASSAACQNQAFAIGDHVLALQFHLETTRDAAQALIENGRDEIDSGGAFVQDAAAILADESRFDHLRRHLADALGPFLNGD